MKNSGEESIRRNIWPAMLNGLDSDSSAVKRGAANSTRLRDVRKLHSDAVEKVESPAAHHQPNDLAKERPYCLTEPLVTYKYDHNLAREEKVIITVKTTLQLHRNIRQEEQQLRARPDIFGRDRTRNYVHGLVAAIPLVHDQLDWTLRNSDWAFSALEPYCLDAWGSMVALAGASYLRLIDMDTGVETPCRHPWLCQVHSVQFSANGKRLLAASTGFDAVIEFDTASGDVTWEWFAWENGFDRSMLGHYVVRLPEKRDALVASGQEAIYIDDPSKFEEGIATRLIPAHLNSARYDSDGHILVSMFHQGTGIIIDRHTGHFREIVSGLINPHKLERRRQGGYFISDTRAGQLVLVDEEYRREREIIFDGLPGLERSETLSEFLQNTTEINDDLYACVDIHRNSIWLIDAKRRKYRGIKFPPEWSLHDVVCVGEDEMFRIGQLVGTVFGRVEAAEQSGMKLIRHFSTDGTEVANLMLDAQSLAVGLDVEM
jgi:hypothetical protein